MRIERIQIANFRNFAALDVRLGQHAVIVGENKVGKSNLLFALRLLLDPDLPDAARQLRVEDFHDGLRQGQRSPIKCGDVIRISVDLTDFEDNQEILALLAEHLVQPEPMVARLTYEFRPQPDLGRSPAKEADYEFSLYGGDRPENGIDHDLRRRLPLSLLPALRDAEGDLESWRRSPLRPLLDRAASQIDAARLEAVAGAMDAAAQGVAGLNEIRTLSAEIGRHLTDMAGAQALQTSFGFTPTDPDRLIRELRLLIDGGQRGVERASLGSANLLYLTLKALEYDALVAEGKRHHTFLAIEEPEAHLHPHLQRLVFRELLRTRTHQVGADGAAALRPQTLLLTTHAPHVVSVAPLRSLVLLRAARGGSGGTEAVATAHLDLAQPEVEDLERYLDVTRGEALFARGVLLVEGDAEEYLVPVLAGKLGQDLDKLGITVCNVRGTNFTPYVKFFGPDGLAVPLAVLTDRDPQGDGNLGDARGDRLRGQADVTVFLNDHTLELALWDAGWQQEMCSALDALAASRAARHRAAGWAADPGAVNREQLLKDIAAIGKGRFAQRLAWLISHSQADYCPAYIREAIDHVAAQC